MKTKIDVQDVFNLANERGRMNRPELKDLEFINDGKICPIPNKVLEDWEFTGLSNVDFILNYEWPDED
jgi:hypothetical protein